MKQKAQARKSAAKKWQEVLLLPAKWRTGKRAAKAGEEEREGGKGKGERVKE